MTFEARCPHCNFTYEAEETWLGMEAECPNCNILIVIEKNALLPDQEIDKIQDQVNHDGIPLDTNQEETSSLKIKERAPTNASQTSQDTTSQCPNCHSSVSEDAVICIECGTNLKTGDALQTNVQDQQNSSKKLFVLIGFVVALVVIGVGAILFLNFDKEQKSGNVVQAKLVNGKATKQASQESTQKIKKEKEGLSKVVVSSDNKGAKKQSNEMTTSEPAVSEIVDFWKFNVEPFYVTPLAKYNKKFKWDYVAFVISPETCIIITDKNIQSRDIERIELKKGNRTHVTPFKMPLDCEDYRIHFIRFFGFKPKNATLKPFKKLKGKKKFLFFTNKSHKNGKVYQITANLGEHGNSTNLSFRKPKNFEGDFGVLYSPENLNVIGFSKNCNNEKIEIYIPKSVAEYDFTSPLAKHQKYVYTHKESKETLKNAIELPEKALAFDCYNDKFAVLAEDRKQVFFINGQETKQIKLQEEADTVHLSIQYVILTNYDNEETAFYSLKSGKKIGSVPFYCKERPKITRLAGYPFLFAEGNRRLPVHDIKTDSLPQWETIFEDFMKRGEENFWLSWCGERGLPRPVCNPPQIFTEKGNLFCKVYNARLGKQKIEILGEEPVTEQFCVDFNGKKVWFLDVNKKRLIFRKLKDFLQFSYSMNTTGKWECHINNKEIKKWVYDIAYFGKDWSFKLPANISTKDINWGEKNDSFIFKDGKISGNFSRSCFEGRFLSANYTFEGKTCSMNQKIYMAMPMEPLKPDASLDGACGKVFFNKQGKPVLIAALRSFGRNSGIFAWSNEDKEFVCIVKDAATGAVYFDENLIILLIHSNFYFYNRKTLERIAVLDFLGSWQKYKTDEMRVMFRNPSFKPSFGNSRERKGVIWKYKKGIYFCYKGDVCLIAKNDVPVKALKWLDIKTKRMKNKRVPYTYSPSVLASAHYKNNSLLFCSGADHQNYLCPKHPQKETCNCKYEDKNKILTYYEWNPDIKNFRPVTIKNVQLKEGHEFRPWRSRAKLGLNNNLYIYDSSKKTFDFLDMRTGKIKTLKTNPIYYTNTSLEEGDNGKYYLLREKRDDDKKGWQINAYSAKTFKKKMLFKTPGSIPPRQLYGIGNELIMQIGEFLIRIPVGRTKKSK